MSARFLQDTAAEPQPSESYLASLGLPPYIHERNELDNRNSWYGVVVEILGWIMAFSSIFLTGLFLNWYLYTRHERIDRVFVEEIIQEEGSQIEDDNETSIDRRAREEFPQEPIELFEVEGVNHYTHMDELIVLLDRLQDTYWEVFDKETDTRLVSDHNKKVL